MTILSTQYWCVRNRKREKIQRRAVRIRSEREVEESQSQRKGECGDGRVNISALASRRPEKTAGFGLQFKGEMVRCTGSKCWVPAGSLAVKGGPMHHGLKRWQDQRDIWKLKQKDKTLQPGTNTW